MAEFDTRYLYIDKINVKTIFTTNVYDLLYKVYASSDTHYLNDLDIKGRVFNDRRAVDIVALHGCVIDDNRPLSFSAFDIASAFRFDPDRWHLLAGGLQSHNRLSDERIKLRAE